MHRKKPFSGKQKKKQLQEKRQNNNQIEESGNAAKKTVNKNTRGNNNNAAKNKQENRLRTVFERVDDSVIEERKKNSREPVKRDFTGLRVADVKIYATLIDFPKRPEWDSSMSAKQMEEREQRFFSNWLNAIYLKYPREKLNFFEHNLEVWRQLWRVCEMSDILLLLSDARHPLFHFPPSLYNYITIELKKPMVLVLNKIDLVTKEHVDSWIEYFSKKYSNLIVIPFTSHPQNIGGVSFEGDSSKKRKVRGKKGRRFQQVVGDVELMESIYSVYTKHFKNQKNENEFSSVIDKLKKKHSVFQSTLEKEQNKENGNESDDEGEEDDEDDEDEEDEEENEDSEENEEAEEDDEVEEEEATNIVEDDSSYVTIGLIGHPNVGKSSLINGLKGSKVVSTSRTPGHTKHFQTIFINKRIRLCDSPGLVFPALDMPRELQILCGLFPISQSREPYSSISFLIARVPVEKVYQLIPPTYGQTQEDDYFPQDKADHQWSGWDICEAYAIKRSYTTKKGNPDTYRAGLEILRDVLDGVILLTFSPPPLEEVSEVQNSDGEEEGDHKETAEDSDDGENNDNRSDDCDKDDDNE